MAESLRKPSVLTPVSTLRKAPRPMMISSRGALPPMPFTQVWTTSAPAVTPARVVAVANPQLLWQWDFNGHLYPFFFFFFYFFFFLGHQPGEGGGIGGAPGVHERDLNRASPLQPRG